LTLIIKDCLFHKDVRRYAHKHDAQILHPLILILMSTLE
jgi:hypothetical protein